MTRLLLIAVFGLLAQLVDGALGMAYGVTSTTLLLAFGIAPAIASASVHIAEVGTTLMSGAAHAKFGNVDWRAVGFLGVPGAIGAFLGAHVLTSLSAASAKPLVAGILLVLGLYVIARFSFLSKSAKKERKPIRRRVLSPLGLFAGFLDSIGGGGWGPVATPTLLASGRMEPRKVIGSVDTSEFFVSVAASIGFLLALSMQDIPVGIVLAMMIGGMIAAPIAAWIVQKLHARMMGALVGSVVLITNTKTLLGVSDFSSNPTIAVYLVVIAICAAAIVLAVRAIRHEHNNESIAVTH